MFPVKLFFRMTFFYTLIVSVVLLLTLAFDISQTLQVFCVFVFGFFAFVFSAYWSLTPIVKARSYLTKLLDMPRIENLKVEDVDSYQQVFRKGEWVELGELFIQLEGKLRRRTKAYLREATELSAVMNSLTTPIVSVTNQMDVSFMNSAFAVLFDLDQEKLKTLKTAKFKDLVSSESLIASFENVFEEENFEKTHETLTIEGRERRFLISMAPLKRQADSSVYGLVASFSDETQKIQLDQKRMDFVANASHELRTPITAICTSASLLEKISDPKDQKEIVKSLSSNSDRLMKLTRELLDLSKLEGQSKEELNYELCDLKKLSLDALNLLSHPDKNSVEIATSVETFWLDESKVKQVVTNLIKNALIHTPEKTKVNVEWVLEDDDLVLYVKDQGAGVPEHLSDRIFERFYRLDKSRSRVLGGSGIGLSIVKHIVALHGGEVSLEAKNTDSMNGSVFRCTFKKNNEKIYSSI